MTKNWRILVMLPPEIDEEVRKLKEEEPYKAMSFSALIRHLVAEGIKAEKETA